MEEHCSAFRHLGYRKQIAPIAQRGMAELLSGISVNSSDVVAGIYDIMSHGFYKHSIRHFLMQVPKHLSRPNEFSPFLKPYVSDKFSNLIGSDWHEQIIGSFFRYYLIRFPLLVLRVRPIGWPRDLGVSEEDLEETARYALTRFERYFPIATKRLLASDPGEPRGILSEFTVGKEIASQYEVESDNIREFLYDPGRSGTILWWVCPGCLIQIFSTAKLIIMSLPFLRRFFATISDSFGTAIAQITWTRSFNGVRQGPLKAMKINLCSVGIGRSLRRTSNKMSS